MTSNDHDSVIVSYYHLPMVIHSYMSLGGHWFPTIRIYLVILLDFLIVGCLFVVTVVVLV